MRVFIAESLPGKTVIEIISRRIGMFQTPIRDNLLQIVEKLDQSDVILVPHDAYFFSRNFEYLNYLNELAKFKPVIFSDRGDFPKKPSIANSLAFRVALNPGESSTRKIIVPYNVLSLAELPFRNYESVPEISFVGYVPKITYGRVLRTLYQTPGHPIIGNGALVRRLSINKLKRSSLSTNIIVRDVYGAHTETNSNPDKTREEYLNHISESDFVLAPRGDANQSARFYEVLSAGRIPILPDTKMVLPRINQMETNKQINHLVYSLLSKRNLVNSVFSIWDSIDNRNYHRMQTDLRDYFVKNFEFNGFMQRFFESDITGILGSSQSFKQ
jgi:hypothetical protein